MVLMATVAIFIMNLSGKMVKGTTTQFQREQAMLLAKSYTEYAILAVTANERNATCLDSVSGSYGNYNIDVNISYIGNGLGLGDVSSCSHNLNNAVVTDDSPLNIIVDVFVHYPDIDHPDNLKMTYHRRSLQKI